MKLSNRCYCVTGLSVSDYFSVNSGFVIGDKETVIFDSGFTIGSAQTIYGYAHSINPSNRISCIINLEKHFDHIFGNGFFIDKGTKIYAHKLVSLTQKDIDDFIQSGNDEIKIERRRKNKEAYLYFQGVKPFTPDVCVDKDTILDIEGVTIHIYVTPGHTETNLIAYIKEESVAYVADTLYAQYLPTLRFGDKKLWNLWLKSLNLLEELNPGTVVPGHGNVLRGKQIKEEINRHKKILEHYKEAVS